MNLSSFILKKFDEELADKERQLKELEQTKEKQRANSNVGNKLLTKRKNRTLKYQEILDELILMTDEDGVIHNLKTVEIASKLKVTNSVVYGLITTLIKYKYVKQLSPKCQRGKVVKILKRKIQGALAIRDEFKDKKIISDIEVLKYFEKNKDEITNEITVTYRQVAKALGGEWWHVNSSVLRLINVNKLKLKKVKHPQKGNTYEILEGETQCN